MVNLVYQKDLKLWVIWLFIWINIFGSSYSILLNLFGNPKYSCCCARYYQLSREVVNLSFSCSCSCRVFWESKAQVWGTSGQQCQVTVVSSLLVMVLLTWGVYLGAGFNPLGRKSQNERLKQEEKESKVKKKNCLWSHTLNQPLNSYKRCVSVAPLCCGEWITNIAAVLFQICGKKAGNATPALLSGNWGAAGLWDLSAIIQGTCSSEAPEGGCLDFQSSTHANTKS